VSTPFSCPSTHGGSGYPPATRVAPDGKLYCPFCGVEMDPRPFQSGQATYIPQAPQPPPPRRKLIQRLFPWLFWSE
jgi:hypothetical protein